MPAVPMPLLPVPCQGCCADCPFLPGEQPTNGCAKFVAKKPVSFLGSHRFWSLVMAVGGGLPTTGGAIAAGIALMPVNPVMGVFSLIGAVVGLAGTAGLAWFGIRSNREIKWTGNGKQEPQP
jgi:hypothetical protein